MTHNKNHKLNLDSVRLTKLNKLISIYLINVKAGIPELFNMEREDKE